MTVRNLSWPRCAADPTVSGRSCAGHPSRGPVRGFQAHRHVFSRACPCGTSRGHAMLGWICPPCCCPGLGFAPHRTASDWASAAPALQSSATCVCLCCRSRHVLAWGRLKAALLASATAAHPAAAGDHTAAAVRADVAAREWMAAAGAAWVLVLRLLSSCIVDLALHAGPGVARTLLHWGGASSQAGAEWLLGQLCCNRCSILVLISWRHRRLRACSTLAPRAARCSLLPPAADIFDVHRPDMRALAAAAKEVGGRSVV